MKLSRSPSQKLEWSTCDFEVSSAEISAPNSPANSFGNSSLSTFAFGASAFMARDEVAPGILAPGVVLVDAGIDRDVLLLGEDVARRRRRCPWWRAASCGTRICAASPRRCAACRSRKHGERLQLLGDRRDREAIARRDVADHGVDLVALHEVAEFGDRLRGRAGLVDEFDLDLGAAEADLCCRARALCRR